MAENVVGMIGMFARTLITVVEQVQHPIREAMTYNIMKKIGTRDRGFFIQHIIVPELENEVLLARTLVQLLVTYSEDRSLHSDDRIEKLEIVHQKKRSEISIEYFDHWRPLSKIVAEVDEDEDEDEDEYEYEYEDKEDELTRFEIHETLGSGAFGKVVRVTHPDTPGLNYAMKIIDRCRRKNAEVEEFASTKFCEDLVHTVEPVRLITRAYGDSDMQFVMLPLANRGHLGSRLQQLQKDLKEASGTDDVISVTTQIFRWIYCLVKTLAQVHEKLLVHGDIKLENILVHNTTLIYTDFGLCRLRKVSIFDYASAGSSVDWAPVPPRIETAWRNYKCSCQGGCERFLPLGEPMDTPRPHPRQNMNQFGALGGMSGDVFHLGWIMYEMLMVVTPDLMPRTELPCRITAKIFAWNWRPSFLVFIDKVTTSLSPTEPGSAIPSESENCTNFTMNLLTIIAHYMVIPEAVQRHTSEQLARLMLDAMKEREISPEGCCDGSATFLGKPW